MSSAANGTIACIITIIIFHMMPVRRSVTCTWTTFLIVSLFSLFSLFSAHLNFILVRDVTPPPPHGTTTMMVAIYPALQQPVPGTAHQPPWTALGFLQQLCRISIVSQTTKPGAAPLWQWLSTTTTPTPANRVDEINAFLAPRIRFDALVRSQK